MRLKFCSLKVKIAVKVHPNNKIDHDQEVDVGFKSSVLKDPLKTNVLMLSKLIKEILGAVQSVVLPISSYQEKCHFLLVMRIYINNYSSCFIQLFL